MPLPTPKPNQKEDEFISSCMSSEVMKKDYPDNKQRVAICFSQFKRRKQAKGNVDPTWAEVETPHTITLI